MLNIRDSDGLSLGLRATRAGWVESNCVRRLVARAASVEMYMADLDRPCGGGSWEANRSVRSSWVLPAPL